MLSQAAHGGMVQLEPPPTVSWVLLAAAPLVGCSMARLCWELGMGRRTQAHTSTVCNGGLWERGWSSEGVPCRRTCKRQRKPLRRIKAPIVVAMPTSGGGVPIRARCTLQAVQRSLPSCFMARNLGYPLPAGGLPPGTAPAAAACLPALCRAGADRPAQRVQLVVPGQRPLEGLTLELSHASANA